MCVGNILFSQSLEDQIYLATETFIENPNEASYPIFKTISDTFRNQLKTKDEQLAFVFLLCNRAYYLRFKQPTLAIKDYEEAWMRFEKYKLGGLSDYDMTENCLKPLGNLYIKGGDYTNAENIIKQYLYIAERENNPVHKTGGAINLALLYQILGKHNTVLTIVEEALKNESVTKIQKQKLENIKNTSLVALDKPELAVGQSINSKNGTATYNSVALNYQLALENKVYDSALYYFKLKKALLEKDSVPLRTKSRLAIEEAGIHLMLKNKEAALTNLKMALMALLPGFNGEGMPKKEELYPDATFTVILDLLAANQPATVKALHYYDLSSYVASMLYDNLTSQQSKIENVARNRIRREKCIELLYSKYNKDRDTTHFYRALQYAENSRSLILKETFYKKSLLQKFPNDPLLLREYRLLKDQENYTGLLIKEQLGSSKSGVVTGLNKELHAISTQLKIIKDSIKLKYPRTNSYQVNRLVLQQRLKTDNASLVEYFYGNNAIYQFIINPNSVLFNRIELDEATQKSITSFNNLFENASIINNNITAYKKHAFEIYRLLGLNKLGSTVNLIIIPDGLLSFIPFEALLTAESNTNKYEEMPFLVKKHHIIYNNSISFYNEDLNVPETPGVLGIFPVFEGTGEKLTYSIDEAGYLADEMPVKLLMHHQATKDNFIKEAGKYNTLHFSTHASSGTMSKAASIRFFDDVMTLNEIYGLDLKAQLVVLSACETGVGKVYKSEGPMSLSRGFRYAGVTNVLFSLWPINDMATSQLMRFFYQHYGKYKSEYEANHFAKINYLNSDDIDNSKKSPYYWSSFVFYGNLNHPEENNQIIFYLLGSLVLILIFIYLIQKKYQGKY